MNQLRRLLPFTLCLFALGLTSCQTTGTSSASAHQFATPSADWQTKAGQLAYTDKQTSLIGEVLVRYSKNGDFELTFTKAGGITLLSLRQDATFGKVEGPLARRAWSGPLADRPRRVRGWFELREKIVNGRSGATIRHDSGEQTFTLRF
jgi:hypothetical protein